MKVSIVVAFLFLVSGAFGQEAVHEEIVSECPHPNGFFADAVQCDKYYHCENNKITEKLCPDGLMFNDHNPRVEKCDFPFQSSCEGRPELQPAKASKNCPRANGYFAHPTSTVCDEFFYCSQGTDNKNKCPETLVFSLKTGTCVWPKDAGRVDCVAKKLFNFTCPAEPDEIAVGHPRYADPDDCQFFYVCINGLEPRRNGCGFGTVFDSATTACGSPIDVPECSDYYTEYFKEYFATLKVTGGTPQGDVLSAAKAAGFQTPAFLKPQRISGQGFRRKAPIDQAADHVLAIENAVQLDPKAPTITSNIDRPNRPQRRRKPSGAGGAAAGSKRPLRRRRPLHKRTTTTTTTTTTVAPEYYDDYYYDDDYPATADGTATGTATGTDSKASATQA